MSISPPRARSAPRVLIYSMLLVYLFINNLWVVQNAQHLKPGMLLRFAVGDQGLSLEEGKPLFADIHLQGPANNNRSRRADSCTKVSFVTPSYLVLGILLWSKTYLTMRSVPR